jgi:hypothetical protein
MRTFSTPLLALLLACGTGCSSMADEPSGFVPSGGTSGVGGSSSSNNVPASFGFEMLSDQPLPVAARGQLTLSVQAKPARVYQVRFALRRSLRELPEGASSEPLDAVLDRDLTQTDERGIASVVLTAPSSRTNFQVQAIVENSLSATQEIEVPDEGVTSVLVQPINNPVLRDPTTWVATVHPDTTCASLPGIPPPDGPLHANAAKGQAPLISDVPAGVPLAVTLRSGHFLGGCTSLEALPPSTEPRRVMVALLNRPLDLAASPLNLSLGLNAADVTWQTTLAAADAVIAAALRNGGENDVDTLLDAMGEASDDAGEAFDSARTTENWDATLQQRWGSGSSSKLRDLVQGWLVAGRQKLLPSEAPLLSGLLTPLGNPGQPDTEARASFELDSSFGLAPAKAGFVESAVVSWVASADDTIALGTDLYFVRSRLAMALAERAALQEETPRMNAGEALAQALDCDGLSAQLAAQGADGNLAYASCDAQCLSAWCFAAVDALWRRGSDADGLTPAQLRISATGGARVGEAAEVAGITGKWIGELGENKTGGPVTAAAPQ